MAATASPTPLGGAAQVRMPLRTLRSSHINAASNPRRPSPSLARVTRASHAARAAEAAVEAENRSPEDESSDDESNVAPVLSAAAEELLGGRQSLAAVPGSIQRQASTRNYADYAGGSPMGRDGVIGQNGEPADVRRIASPGQQQQQLQHQHQQRHHSYQPQLEGSALRSKSPRIVRVGSIDRNGSPGSALLRRARSTGSANGSPAQKELRDYKTPAPASRSRAHGQNGDGSPVGSARPISGEPRSVRPASSGKNTSHQSSGGGGGSDVRDSQNQGTVTKDHGTYSSLRIKRLGQGTFLRGPARRGMIRRQSEEEQSPLQRNNGGHADLYAGATDQPPAGNESPVDELAPSRVRFAGGGVEDMPAPMEDVQEAAGVPPGSERRSPVRKHPIDHPTPVMTSAHRRAQSVPQHHQAHPVHVLPSADDKENEPPPSHKRMPSAADVLSDMPLKPIIHNAVKMQDLQHSQQQHQHPSPKRAALATKSANTPLRPAPPPPKMDVVDTATAAAGAMASQKRKKQATASMTVNGRRYTRLDCIGRGGSGKVFRVMAENYKLYALKRVSLEGMDEMAIRGFKGEINLLQKLKDVERVVRLIDYEVNDERQTLTVLMEMGELDMKKLLDPHLDEHAPGGGFDVTFTRYIWREMLECVQAVHEHDVVHSDLKPANFVMVQGRLKLIDFGIANAIADDTVNVHREQQIGTPNYMAPEALVDTNAAERAAVNNVAALTNSSGNGAPPPVAKLMKLGKPSDVWSLGCILYQIVYGRPPFGHIIQTHSKVMAIVSDRHAINFPDKGLGGAPVPIGLVRTLRRCLARDQRLRPSIPELLSVRDPFLHPDADGLIPLSAELLGMIQRKVVSTVRQRGSLPDDAELAMWQPNMFENVKNAIRDGKLQV